MTLVNLVTLVALVTHVTHVKLVSLVPTTKIVFSSPLGNSIYKLPTCH